MPNIRKSYYLADKNKELEFKNFEKFWNDTVYSETEKLLAEYSLRRKKERPELSDLIDRVCNKIALGNISCCPVSDDDVYLDEIGTYYNPPNIFLFNIFYSPYIIGEEITSVDQLKKFLDEHPAFYIVDDCNRVVEFGDFVKEIGQGKISDWGKEINETD